MNWYENLCMRVFVCVRVYFERAVHENIYREVWNERGGMSTLQTLEMLFQQMIFEELSELEKNTFLLSLLLFFLFRLLWLDRYFVYTFILRISEKIAFFICLMWKVLAINVFLFLWIFYGNITQMTFWISFSVIQGRLMHT